ncbi:MCP four helix bundle domain-containing protein, partial [Pseudomonas sp. MD195_PC81_125]
MLLMVVVSYSRLLKIEASESSVRDDAVPGVYYSSMIRGAWVDSYLQTQELLGLKEGQGISSEDAADYKAFETRLQEQMANYRSTVTTDEDRVEFAAFEKDHDTYMQIQDQ